MGHSIYLADDEKSIRELLHSFLASDGYTVRSFESGDALLEAFRQDPAELVILDIMMPGTDGLTVCRELRAVSDIPIILLTAKDSELDYVMGISQGSDDYLTKPFRPTILLMKVKALLRRVEMDRGKRRRRRTSFITGISAIPPRKTPSFMGLRQCRSPRPSCDCSAI
ncbi:MAG: response regulator transcription factor [Anaerovoracaceae bacterium]